MVIETMSKYPKIFVDTMMVEELGLLPVAEGSTWKDPAKVRMFYIVSNSLFIFLILQDGLIIFISFMIWGSVSLLPYLFAFFINLKPKDAQEQYGFDVIFLASCIFTGIALFTLGAFKSLFTAERWYVSGLFMFMNGFLAGLAGYLVGYALGNFFEADPSHV